MRSKRYKIPQMKEIKWTDYKISFCSRCSKPLKRQKTFSKPITLFNKLISREEIVAELIAQAGEWKKQTKEICKNCNNAKHMEEI